MRNFCFVFFLSVLFFACTKQELQFSKKLRDIDTYALTGTREGTLKRLSSLRSMAKTSDQFLSVAKREYRLKELSAAKKTLLKGIQASPHSDVVAFLVHLSIETEEYTEVTPYLFYLYNSPYETLATEFLLLSHDKQIQKSDTSFLLAAFRETGKQAFLVDAALAYIANGQLEQALSLEQERGDAFSEYPWFWATLAFDLGHFSIVLERLEETIALSDMYSDGTDALAEYLKAHILLCADACYGLQDVEMARAYWQMYIDRFSDANPYPHYNRALTAEQAVERAKALALCVQTFPDFYPAVAQYVRSYAQAMLTRKNTEEQNDIHSEVKKKLEERGFYSDRMEYSFLDTQFYPFEPEAMLREKRAETNDPRFSLELLRWQLTRGADIQMLKAQLEKTLEQFPESSEVFDFARFFYAKMGQIDRAFSLDDSGRINSDTFFLGLKSSCTGNTEKALESYSLLFEVPRFQCAAHINYACTKALLGEYDEAIERYTHALDFAQSDGEKSNIHLRIAEILVDTKQYTRAKSVLAYALQLDPENYSAKSLLTQIAHSY